MKKLTFKSLLCLALLMPAVGFTQEAEQQVPEPAANIWQPPDIAQLPSDWWSSFETVSPQVSIERLNIFQTALEQRIQSLDAENLITARNSLANLRSLVSFLEVTDQNATPDSFEPIAAKESYTPEEVLTLRQQWRNLEKLGAQVALEIDQTGRQIGILIERRDSLSRQYKSIDPEAPARLQVGLNRVASRVEYERALKQSVLLQNRLKRIEERTQVVSQQQVYAREHLIAAETMLEDTQAEIAAARIKVDSTEERIVALQSQLLSVLSGETLNASLELLRKQQLTRASAEVAMIRLQQVIAESKLMWLRIRAGEIGSGERFNTAISRSQALIDESDGQTLVWSQASQSTLISIPPESNLNAAKNFEIARTIARDTLVLVDEVKDRSDDLELMLEMLSVEIVSAQSGFGRARAQVSLSFAAFINRANSLLDYGLFDISDTPVTSRGILKMLIIIALALALSWFIRHGLDRATGRSSFRTSPAIYTLGRMLHYIIILIGSLVALGSIGIDFTNFALIAGALSVGIGFGLQAIVSNFVSGLILLFEGSLRVGDYITLDSGLAGVVKEINTRATIVNTNDSVDVVVPNSELVTTKLTNWTLRESVARIRIPFGVAYGSDKELVKQAALNATEEMEFVLLHMSDREPQVRLVNFGDSALEFELLAWLSRQGVRRPNRVRSSFLWALDTQLKTLGIEVPFPQRDLHIRSDARSVKETRGRNKIATRKQKIDQ